MSPKESELTEVTITEEVPYKGKILSVKALEVELENGLKRKREIITFSPVVVILPFEEPHTVHLIKQYRKAAESVLLEAPAGKIDDHEDVLTAAKRELREETGIIAKEWTLLGKGYSAPGFCTEFLYYFAAEGLVHGTAQPDEDERIIQCPHTFDEVEDLLDNHEINDAKTVVGYSLLRRHLQKKGVI